jgi:lipopolysaccharide export LptBFGC system permease protein LptF
MKQLKYIFVLAILAQSTPAYADHEEGLIPMFLGFLTILVLAVTLFAVRLNRIGKLLLAIICLLAIVLTFSAVDSLSVLDHLT